MRDEVLNFPYLFNRPINRASHPTSHLTPLILPKKHWLFPPFAHKDSIPTGLSSKAPSIIIWGTMTLVIFYTNALSPYCPGGGTKKKMPARAATILKNFFRLFSILI